MAWWEKSEIANSMKKLILILKLDAENLFNRLDLHLTESLSILAIKRNRSHFDDLFENKYSTLGVEVMAELPEETIVALNNFYVEVSELRWYLLHTENQPQMIQNNCERIMKKIRSYYDTLHIFLEAELKDDNLEENFDEFSSAD